MDTAISNIIAAFYRLNEMQVQPLALGLINTTWTCVAQGKKYILQKVNTHVFKDPSLIDANLRLLAFHLKQYHPNYLFTAPVQGKSGETLCRVGDEYYRMFPFIDGSHTIDTVQTPQQAYEAAKQFGTFTALLNEFDASKLNTTIPRFHDLAFRFEEFEQAAANGNKERIAATANEIEIMYSHRGIVEKFIGFTHNPDTKKRVTHHDTKISNVLFDKNDKGLCVIDLDTVMPGYFISDVGDMIRTYVCPVSEEENDLDKIVIREDFLSAVAEGYLSAMKPYLSSFEQEHFYFSGEVLIYMQALRFLADYLNCDVYYGSRYLNQNLVRAKNQLKLLEQFRNR